MSGHQAAARIIMACAWWKLKMLQFGRWSVPALAHPEVWRAIQESSAGVTDARDKEDAGSEEDFIRCGETVCTAIQQYITTGTV